MESRARVGVLINTLYSDYSVSFMKGTERFCKENNCIEFMLPLSRSKTSGPYDYHYDTLLNFINSSNLDGLVIATSTFCNNVQFKRFSLEISKLPNIKKVSVGLPLQDIPDVCPDCEYAVKKIVTHLIKDHGCKRFLVVRSNKGNYESDLREKYIRETLNNFNITLEDDHILSGSFEFEIAYTVISNYLKNNIINNKLNFDACVCLNDNMALAALRCFADNNIKVPNDVVVTGFDNSYESSSVELDFTTIDQRIEEMAYIACQNLYTQIQGKPVDLHKTIKSVPIFRSSCGCTIEELAILRSTEGEAYHIDGAPLERLLANRHDIFRRSGNQLYMLHYFLMESQKPVSIEKLYNRLLYSLAIFDVQGAIVVLFERPLVYEKNTDFMHPESARVVMSYTSEMGIKIPNLDFNSQDFMIPPQIVDELHGAYVVLPLFAENMNYGYILMKFGRYERIFYQTIFELISKEIINSINISKEEIARNSLKKENLTLEEYSEKLQLLSRTDEMTTLLNRRGFYEKSKNVLDFSKKHSLGGLVIYGDMDGLKIINDTFGHEAGDRAIKYEAEILKKIFNDSCIVGRLGGDEFAIIAQELTAEDFKTANDAIILECNKLNQKSGEPFEVSISLGFSEFTKWNYNLDKLLSEADKNQYIEKRRKKKMRH